MSELEQLAAAAERFRASGSLGKPGALSRLFDFLLTRTLAGEAPKELEIALEVFGNSPSFGVSQDAVVYAHKLRRRLDDVFVRDGKAADDRLVIPKGEYRILFERPATHASRRSRWLASAVCATLTWFVMRTAADREQQSLQASDVWTPLAGTRDTGVRQIAEVLSNPVALEPLIDEARGVQSFEALYEVYGVAQASIKSKLLFANAMRDVSIWDVR